MRPSCHQASASAASTGSVHSARAPLQPRPHCSASGDSCAPKAPPPMREAEYTPIIGATWRGVCSLIRPGSVPCTSATPTPHSAAVASSQAGARRSAQPRASSVSASASVGRAPRRGSSAGASQVPAPISAMGSSVSQASACRPSPVCACMVGVSGPMAVRKGRRFSVTSTTVASQASAMRGRSATAALQPERAQMSSSSA